MKRLGGTKGLHKGFDFSVKLKGVKRVTAKADQMARDLSGRPVEDAMRKATMVVTRSARKRAPVDTGVLRASIMPEVVMRDRVITGVVGSNVKYAPYQEFGTRPIPNVPRSVIWRWALRKSSGNQSQARSLFARAYSSIRRFGVKAKRYLRGALEEELPKVKELLFHSVEQIVRRK